MKLEEFLNRLVEEVPNFQIWSHGKDSDKIGYSWKARSGVNQWEYSETEFYSAEEALLDFLSQVSRFILDRNG